MNITFFSNPPWSGTGYGVQMRLFLSRLPLHFPENSYSIIANCGLQGVALEWEGITVFPSTYQGTNKDILRFQMEEQLKTDVVISLYDAWSLPHDIFGEVPHFPWFMFDREPAPVAVIDAIRKASNRIACTKKAQSYCQEEAGMDCLYSPLAYDPDEFFVETPEEIEETRKKLGVGLDKFLVLIVADNKGWPNRKALSEQIQGFAEFAKEIPQAHLYLHTMMDSSRGGLKLDELVKYLGITERVTATNQEALKAGAIQPFYLRKLYNAADVLLNVSMDEGFGVPILEAQACGTPVVVGDWTAMPEIAVSGSRVSKEEAVPFFSPTGGFQYLVHPSGVCRALDFVHTCLGDGNTVVGEELAVRVEEYRIDRVIKTYWPGILHKAANAAQAVSLRKDLEVAHA